MKAPKLLLLVFAGLLLFAACKNHKNKSNKNTNNQTQISDSSSIESLSKQIRQNPKNAELFKMRSKLYVEEGKPTEAINDLHIALKLDSLDRETYYSLIDLNMRLGQSGKAKETAEKCLTVHEGDKEALLRLAQIHFYVRNYTQALEYIRLIKSYNHQDADSYFIEALIYREMQKPAKAIECLQSVIEYQPNRAEAYNMLGQLLMEAGDPLALEYFKSGLRKAPKDIDLLYSLGYYYQINNYTDSAINQYNQLIAVTDSLHYGALYNSGYVQLVDKENYPEAVKFFTAAINIDSLSYKAYYNRGYAFELQERYAQARDDYNQALKIEPNYPLAIQGLNALDNK